MRDGGLSKAIQEMRSELTSREINAAQEITAIALEPFDIKDKAEAWFEVLEELTPMVGISLSTYSIVTGAPRTIAAAHYQEPLLRYLDGSYLRNDPAYQSMLAKNRRDFNWSTAGFDYATSHSAVNWFRPEGYSGGSTSMLHTRDERYVANLHISTESPDLPDRRALSFIQLIAPVISATIEPHAWYKRLANELRPGAKAAFVSAEGKTLTVTDSHPPELLYPRSKLVQQVNYVRDIVGDALTGPRRWLWQTSDGEWHTVHCVRLDDELLVLHEPSKPPYDLTKRELEVTTLISVGATNREAARALQISERTVMRHLENVMAKSHIQNRTQLGFCAVTQGFCLLTEVTIPFIVSNTPLSPIQLKRTSAPIEYSDAQPWR